MSSDSHTADAFIQLDELTHKRTALESLISIALGIHSQQKAMEELSLIARPSQEIPAKIIRNLQAFEEKHAGLTDEELKLWLDSIEQTTQTLVEKVALLANLELQSLRDKPIKGLSIEGFRNLIADFQRRTQTSLALRFVLKNRGVILQSFKLPFPQESIAEQVQALKEKEEKCIAQIKSEAQTIVEDTRALLTNQTFPDKIKEQLLSVQQAMESNLAHLDSGGSVATLPNKFEVVILQADEPVNEHRPAAPAPKPSPIAPPVESGPTSPREPEHQKRLSTFRLLLKWLTTPMNTTWKSLKEESQLPRPKGRGLREKPHKPG